MKYNPFAYLRSEKDILKLVNTIIANTKGDGEKSGEDFWVKAEKLYYTALIGYIWYEAPDEEKNFTTLLEMINASEAREDDEDFQNPVDLMFERLEEKDPEHFAVKQYKKYKLAAGKTAKSILSIDFLFLKQAVRASLRCEVSDNHVPYPALYSFLHLACSIHPSANAFLLYFPVISVFLFLDLFPALLKDIKIAVINISPIHNV